MKRPEFLRRILKSRKLQTLFAYLIHVYAKFVFRTTKWDLHFPDPNPIESALPKIFVFWHSRLFLMPFFKPRNRRIFGLISFHNDGMIAAKVMHFFGIGVVSGSRRKGGGIAALKAIRAIRSGGHLVITPDGPRGPQERASVGTIHIASVTGAEIVPASYSVSPCRRLASWDRFIFPFPFAKGVMVCGESMFVPPGINETETERYRLSLENSLNEVTTRADELLSL